MAASHPQPSLVLWSAPFLLIGMGLRISELEGEGEEEAPGPPSTPTLFHSTDGETEAQEKPGPAQGHLASMIKGVPGTQASPPRVGALASLTSPLGLGREKFGSVTQMPLRRTGRETASTLWQ